MLRTADDHRKRTEEYRRLAADAGGSTIQAYLLVLAEQFEEEARDLIQSPLPNSSDR